MLIVGRHGIGREVGVPATVLTGLTTSRHGLHR